MLRTHHLCAAVLIAGGLFVAPGTARAAESYDNCTGFIDSVPATIGTQGTWCLRKDLSTAMTSGAAIIIATNNVTIDCNDFKLGGLAAGNGTATDGIYALSRLNATVRHCNIRGFRRGVGLFGIAGGGHVVEDNRLDSNTYVGLYVVGDGSVVRRNQVLDTGGGAENAFGIYAWYGLDVLDNTVSGVLPGGNASGNGSAYGIYTANNPNGSLSGNRVRGLVPLGIGGVYGIYNSSSGRISLRGNDVVNISPASTGSGIHCSNASGAAMDNIIAGFGISTISGCTDHGNAMGL